VTIVSIRGTHGSGKSSIVKAILNKYEGRGIGVGKRPEGYTVELLNGERLFVVGPYHTSCGGCDAVQPYGNILKLIHSALPDHEHVLFEGALVSSSYGTIGAWMGDNLECDPVFAFLDTPLATCLERIKERRARKGNLEPLNPHNTTVKFENVARTKQQMAKLGSQVRIVDIDHTKPVQQIMKLFGVTLRKEPPWAA
jgi:thymidylate kinase